MFFFCKQKTAYEMRISDWSSDVCSSDLCSSAASHPQALPPAPKDRWFRTRYACPVGKASPGDLLESPIAARVGKSRAARFGGRPDLGPLNCASRTWAHAVPPTESKHIAHRRPEHSGVVREQPGQT